MGTGKKIKELADARGINLHKLATMTEIKYTTLFSIVSRDSDRISPDKVSAIARALKVPITELMPISPDEDIGAYSKRIEDVYELEGRKQTVRDFMKFSIPHQALLTLLNDLGVTFTVDRWGYVCMEYQGKQIPFDNVLEIVQLQDFVYEQLCNKLNSVYGLDIDTSSVRSEKLEYLAEISFDWIDGITGGEDNEQGNE